MREAYVNQVSGLSQYPLEAIKDIKGNVELRKVS